MFTGRGKYGGISLLPGNQVDLAKLTISEADVLRTVGLDVDGLVNSARRRPRALPWQARPATAAPQGER